MQSQKSKEAKSIIEPIGVAPAEAARLAGIGRTIFLRELKAGRGPRICRFGRRVVVPVESLKAWLRERAAAEEGSPA